MNTANRNNRLEHRLLEAFDALWDDFVDPREPYADVDGSGGRRSAARSGRRPRLGAAPFNEQQLRELRAQCRRLATANEFAINGHENRISYIVGPGHSYRADRLQGHGRAAPDAGAGRCKRCSTSFSTRIAGTSGSRRSSAASIATAKRSCGSSSTTTA